ALVGGTTNTGGVVVVVVELVLGFFLQAETRIKTLNAKMIGFLKDLKMTLFDIYFLKFIVVSFLFKNK
ncbi:MAG: hypothetical protein HQ491_08575, partial [Bacteroidetes bacterium]|nr:hypothetical protein [Bacteroidota bacterium]